MKPKNILRFLKSTFRPISLLVAIPIFLSNWLNGVRDIGAISAYCCFGVCLACLANLGNNLDDRRDDRNHNPGKLNLATTKPGVVLWLVMTAILAVGFAEKFAVDNPLIPILVVSVYVYNQIVVRIPIVKRLAVALIVSTTCFLQPVRHFNGYVWLIATLLFIYIYRREGVKDRVDLPADRIQKFLRLDDLMHLYWWFLTAPALGVVIVIGSAKAVHGRINFETTVLAISVGIAIWSYLNLRYHQGHFYPKNLAGHYFYSIIGLQFVMLTSLRIPSSVAVWVVVANCLLILLQAILLKSIRRVVYLIIVVDAWFWGSLFLVAICQNNIFNPIVIKPMVLTISLVLGHEIWRLSGKPCRYFSFTPATS